MATFQLPVRSTIHDFPQELLEAICAHVFYAGVPSFAPSLDPLIGGAPNPPAGLPNSFPAASWTDHLVRKTLASLCMVNKAWYFAAKPQLWRRLEVRLPRSWLSLVDELAGGVDSEAQAAETALVVGKSLEEAQNAALAARSIFVQDVDQGTAEKLHSDIMARLDGSVPPEVSRRSGGVICTSYVAEFDWIVVTSIVTLASRITRSESMEVARQEPESNEVEAVEINLRCGTECHVTARVWNLRYVVIDSKSH